MNILALAQMAGEFLDLIGVFVIIAGALFSTVLALIRFVQKDHIDGLYTFYRQSLGRSILLGLEFLVAGDIIRSVTGTPSFTAIGVLVIIVIVRSFLSITFDMEIEGRWPWQRKRNAN